VGSSMLFEMWCVSVGVMTHKIVVLLVVLLHLIRFQLFPHIFQVFVLLVCCEECFSDEVQA
jgi:hypothetical protein